MKRILLISFFFVMFFINVNYMSAVTADDYKVGRYIYYNPFTNETCSSNNYWTVYNQTSKCYRWAIVQTNKDLGIIRIIVDHDIGVSTSSARNTVIANAMKEWKIPALSTSVRKGLGISDDDEETNAEASLGISAVLSLYKGNIGINRTYYEINSKWDASNPTSVSYYTRVTPNTANFISTNVRIGYNGKGVYDYNSIGDLNIAYPFSSKKHPDSEGYWLTNSNNTLPFGAGDSRNDEYGFFINASGNIGLASKTKLKGVRPVIWIEISALGGNTFDDTSFNLFDKTLVGDATSSTVSIGTQGQNFSTNKKYHPQGFSVIGENKALFYMTPVGGLDEDTVPGILIYNNGNTFSQVYSGILGHGNDIAYDKKNALLYITKNISSGYTVSKFKLNTSSISLTKLEDLNYSVSTFAIDDNNKYFFTLGSNRRINVNRMSDGKTIYYFDAPSHGTGQGMTYVNGYLYFSVAELCYDKYQNYCIGKKNSFRIYVYNVKFNPDGTPNRWFGHSVATFYAEDMANNNQKVYEIEGVGAYNDEIYMGFSRKNYNSSGGLISYVPAIYKYKQTFHTLTYKLGSETYSEKVFNDRFVDMGLYLDGKTHDNGFIGWKAPDGTIYNHPDSKSFRISENTTLNGVYIEPNSNYTFKNDGLNISYRAKVSNVLSDIKAYNCTLKIYRNGTDITSSINEYIKYGDVLKVVPTGTLANTGETQYNLYPQKYLVTYNNGISNTTEEHSIGDEITYVNNVSKEGYTLTGFTYNDVSYKLTDKITMPKKDITLTAIWTANTYTLSYDSSTSTKTITYNSVYGDLPIPTKTGYTFRGWYLENTYKTLIAEDVRVTTSNNHKLYARWEANTYTLSYDSSTSTKPVTYNLIYGDLPTPTKTGYTFKGWYLESNYVTLVTPETKVTIANNHKLYAKWQANSYTLSYDSSTSTKTVIYNSVYGDLPIPSKTGYAFRGWYLENTYNTLITKDTKVTITNNHKLYAKWEAADVKVTFDAISSFVEVAYNSTYGDLPIPTKTGYTFKGWYLENTYNTLITKDTKVITSSDHKLYAKWEANSYTLSYDSSTSTKTVTYNSLYGDLPTPIKDGYTFAGWYLENTYNTPVTSTTKVTTADNHKLYAKWSNSAIKITYDVNNSTKDVVYNSVYGELLVPTKKGYAFKGWYLENTYKTLITKDTKVIRNYNHMLYGKWELIKPDITKTSDYEVKNGMVSNVKLKAEIKDLNLGLESYYKVKVQDKNKKDKTTGKMATNDKVQIYLDNTLVDEYTVVIKGDVTGTGEASVSDVAKLYQHLKKKITMEDCYIEAGNVYSDDNEIKINDVAKLYQFIKGKIKTLD